MEWTDMIRYNWLRFRHWLASRLIGYRIHDAIDNAFDWGRNCGHMETLRDLAKNAPPTV